MRFVEIIGLKFGKQLPYIACILQLFRIMVAKLSLKNVVTLSFLFEFQQPLLRSTWTLLAWL